MSAESILQVRAALMCDGNRLEKHIHSRLGSLRTPKHFNPRKPRVSVHETK